MRITGYTYMDSLNRMIRFVIIKIVYPVQDVLFYMMLLMLRVISMIKELF